ncbi:hypothetical protein [Octadecabacter arcticus]|nr:hypothetical protein [Octadecabacter arcticus]
MMDNSYIELNGGYDFNNGGFDFGIGGGWANTTDGDAAPVEESPREGGA